MVIPRTTRQTFIIMYLKSIVINSPLKELSLILIYRFKFVFVNAILRVNSIRDRRSDGFESQLMYYN